MLRNMNSVGLILMCACLRETASLTNPIHVVDDRRGFMKLIGGPEEKPPLYKAIGPNKGELKVKLKCKRKRG